MVENTTHTPAYEYEERAFLDEKSFLRIKNTLDTKAIESSIDNKQSFFYVLPDVNVSIAHSKKDTKVKYKGGQLGKGNGFEEIEFHIPNDALDEAVALFTKLLHLSPQRSFQYRINYVLNDSIEIALKYTQMWGFHLEVEKVYYATTPGEKKRENSTCKKSIEKLARELEIQYITDKEMADFTLQCKNNILRGEYSEDIFEKKYSHLFGL